MNEIDFEQGQFGTKATIKVPWHDSLLELLLKHDIRELELNTGKGWRGKNIEFLKEFSMLRSLTILHQSLDLIEPIHYLHELVDLHLTTYSDIPVDFSAFPKLTDCWFEWIKGSDSLFDCKDLKSLGVNNYKKKSSKPFSNLEHLENVTILNSTIEDLDGIFELTQLKEIRIANLRKITSLKGIEALKNLEVFDMDTCKNINSISEIFSLTKLKKLFILNSGNIDTIHGLENLSDLTDFILYESTNILDGDLSSISKLKHLKKVAFKNRRHYTHACEEFGKLYFGENYVE